MTIVTLMIAGFFGTPLVAFIMSLAALPASYAVVAAMKGRTQVPTFAAVVVSLFQAFPALTWVLVIQEYTRWRVSNESAPIFWLSWSVALAVGVAPALKTLRLAARDRESGNIQNLATPFTVLLTFIGYLALLMVPSLRDSLWAWLPRWFS
jgi:hypothetical protein